MTQQEALEFLELSKKATADEIKARLAEKLLYFETQSEKAPSDFLRRLSLRKLDTVKTILKESLAWPVFMAQPKPVMEEPVTVAEEDIAQTVYIVPRAKEAANKKAADQPAGWLIKHMENQPARAFALKPGNNFIGRKAQPALSPFIVIDGDDYISRVQCVVYAEGTGPYTFYISDPSSFNNGKTSKNGNFVNGNSNIITAKVKLTDGDTIQLGVTKLVVKFNTGDVDDIIKEVEKTAYMDTVVINA